MELENKKHDIRFVALYIRKSRAESLEDLEKHRIILTDLCKKNNFKFVEYMEVGTSDSIDMRPKISKLLKEVEEGVYDAVCVVEYDRLSRGDMGDQDRIAKIFKKAETLIITPDKIYNLNDEIDDEIVEFKGFMARREYKMITKRLRQGKKIGARQGQWTNGIPPFPYVYQRYNDKYNEKGLVVDDEKYKLYRRIIEMALDGMIPQKIAANLNQHGLLTPKGNFWSGTTIQRTLIDETHLGKIISNKTQGDGHKNKRPNAKDHKRLPKSEWVIIENCHEAVKTLEEHDSILQMLNERTIIPRKGRKQTHAFTGLIKCAICGHSHTFQQNHGKLCLRSCWYVNSFGDKCLNKGEDITTFEDIVLSEIRKYQNIFLTDLDQKLDTIHIEIEKKIALIEEEIVKYRKALDNINDAYEIGEYSKQQWLERKKKREDKLIALNEELYFLNQQLAKTPITSFEERRKQLAFFWENIMSVTTNNERNTLYRSIIESIVWRKEGNNNGEMKINFR